MEISADVRPKLKQDSIFLPSAQGVVFRNGANVFSLKGKSIYQWVCSLAPHLTGEQTLEELCAPLADGQREMVSKLVSALLDKGLLKNSVPEDKTLLTEAVRARFKSQIDFIDHYAERPLSTFKAFRQSRVLLIGEGASLKSLAVSLARNGLENIVLAPHERIAEDLDEVEVEVNALHRAGVKTSLSVIDAATSPLSVELKQFDVVAYCSDRPSLRTAALLNEKCFREGRLFLAGIMFGGLSLIGPLVKPGTPGCWFCAVMRLSANLDDRRRAALWQNLALEEPMAEEETFLPAAMMLGNGVAFDLFKALGQYLTAETQNGVIVQDLHTMESSRALLSPHPLCPVCSHAGLQSEETRLQAVTEGARDHEQTIEQVLMRWSGCLDSRVGIIQGFTDNDSTQLPLRTSSLSIGHPSNAVAESFKVLVHHEETTLKARYLALAEGVRQYAQALPDKRRVVISSFQKLFERDASPIAPQELSLWSGVPGFDEQADIEWLPASSHRARRIRYVPAATVYPSAGFKCRECIDRTSAGFAIGLSYREALTDGIISMLSYERLREAASDPSIAVSLELQRLSELDPTLAYLVKSVERLEHTPRMIELLGDSPVRVMLVTTDEIHSTAAGAYTIGSGLSRQDAARQALVELVGALQSQESGQGTAVRPSLSPEIVFSPELRAPATAMSLEEEKPATVEDLEDFLRERGRETLFVNTTPADVWETGTFITGRVLLTRGQS
ncbi:MAG TPA: TOMM precursor leader peptide-binding protein [Pyrinomonadaceae bacterium]|jgi:bacteriocin biosynthesis cyclodehydratase domain-containing protein